MNAWNKIMMNFCKYHGVDWSADYMVLGSPKRTRHGCKVTLPLPKDLFFKIGHRAIIRHGDVNAKKKLAFASACQNILKGLRDDGGVDLEDYLEERGKKSAAMSADPYNPYMHQEDQHLAAALAPKEPDAPFTIPYDQSELPDVVVRNRDNPEVAKVLFHNALLMQRFPVFKQHKTLTQKQGPLLQVNARVHPVGVNQKSQVFIKTGFEHEITYGQLELDLLQEVPLLMQKNKILSKQTWYEVDGLMAIAEQGSAMSKGHAEIFVGKACEQLLEPAESYLDEFDTYIFNEEARQTSPRQRRSQSTSPRVTMDRSTELTIGRIREQLLKQLRYSEIVLVEGGTGCGKTTQVPQFILDDPNDLHERRNIIVTQPRRLAAIAVANRVASERGEPLGQSVGYTVHLENVKARGKDTIEFVTAGVLLQRLANNKDALEGVTHVIVDEAHERDSQVDMVVAHIRRLLQSPDSSTKFVIMSATMEIDKLQKHLGCPDEAVLSVPASTNYPVETSFLPDLFKEYGGISKEVSSKMRRLIQSIALLESNDDTFDEPEGGFEGKIEDLTVALSDLSSLVIQCIAHNQSAAEETEGSTMGGLKNMGGILCFLPGWAEIEEVNKYLRKSGEKLQVHKLHSSVSLQDQRRAMQPPLPGHTKVILATSIAETSLTFDDISTVIDSGQVRISRYHTNTCISTLVTDPISKASAQQRLGRVGRLAPGKCIRLYSPNHFEKRMSAHIEPEILRSNLESVMLTAKTLSRSTDRAAVFLAELQDPPLPAQVHAAERRLSNIGAFVYTYEEEDKPNLEEDEPPAFAPKKGKKKRKVVKDSRPQPAAAAAAAAVDERSTKERMEDIMQEEDDDWVKGVDVKQDEHLTNLGWALASLPLDPALGRAVLVGMAVGHPDTGSKIAAILSSPRGVDRLFRIAVEFNIHTRADTESSDIALALEIYEAALHQTTMRARNTTKEASVVVRDISRRKDDIDQRLQELLSRHDPEAVKAFQSRKPLSLEAAISVIACSAMSSHIAYCRFNPSAKKSRASMLTRTMPNAEIDWRSCNNQFLTRTRNGAWFVYNELFESSNTPPTLRGTVQVTPFQIMLFGGDLFTNVSRHLQLSLLDYWIICRSPNVSCDALYAISLSRAGMNAVLNSICSGGDKNRNKRSEGDGASKQIVTAAGDEFLDVLCQSLDQDQPTLQSARPAPYLPRTHMSNYE